MYLSRIKLQFNKLLPGMLEKWHSATPYAAHQWLWQLFPEQSTRPFLFRLDAHGQFFMLSTTPPVEQHALFKVDTKSFNPQLAPGMILDFQLRANPVVTRNKKRSDVMMDAKYHAKVQGIPQQQWWALQQQAAARWLETQGERHGFCLMAPEPDALALWAGEALSEPPAETACVKTCQQHSFIRRNQDAPITFSSVDFAGTLRVTDVSLFEQALAGGLGKSKALGCGLLMVKRAR